MIMPTNNQPKFALGQQIVATPEALEVIEASGQSPAEFLRRHVRLEQGELSDEDRELNSESVTNDDGTIIKSTCLAHCYRGGSFSGVLWSVWERTFVRTSKPIEPTQRWIMCDLLRYERDGWGYKDIEESMGPCYYSCPQKYLDMVPLDQFGGNAEWRELVASYHEHQRDKRRARRAAAS